MADALSDLFDDLAGAGAASPENLFSILDSLDNPKEAVFSPFEEIVFGSIAKAPVDESRSRARLVSERSASPSIRQEADMDFDNASEPSPKRPKLSATNIAAAAAVAAAATKHDGQHRMSHITVERNRRKQMNEHLSVLRSLMPCFYVKRGDQASIIGGVVDYIKELQQVLKSLEAKKQRKVYSEVLSPRTVVSSPRPSPLSPRIGLPISPRTPQPGSPYKPCRVQQQQRQLQQPYLSPPTISMAPSPLDSSSSSFDCTTPTSHDLAANSKSAIADVEVKFSGPNVLLKTVSHRIPGQAMKIISALEGLSLEILHVSISTIDNTMLNSFTIKIGIECELSAEELAQEIQQTFT